MQISFVYSILFVFFQRYLYIVLLSLVRRRLGFAGVLGTQRAATTVIKQTSEGSSISHQFKVPSTSTPKKIAGAVEGW